MTGTWTQINPPADTYTLEVSTANDFSGTLASSTTVLPPSTIGLITPLLVNTTYYGRVKATINGSDSAWSVSATTATLADIPSTVASTWTAVNFTSITVTWDKGINPALVTHYDVRLGTSSNFTGVETSIATDNLSADFTSLVPNTTYYGRVRAINHSGIPTTFLVLGSTRTQTTPTPTNLIYVAASTNTLTGTWTQINTPADTYTLEVSTAIDFTGTLTSSTTILPPSTVGLIAPLLVNTTYYGQVKATINGSDSPWSVSATTATLADVPSTVASTWTSVTTTALTVNWSNGNDPIAVTHYEVRIGTSSDFSGLETAAITDALNSTFSSLQPDTTYYGRLRAINHSGIPTSYLILGSTRTVDSGDRYWVSVVGGNWNDAQNWSTVSGGFAGHSVPSALNNVYFDNAANGNANVDTTVSISSWNVVGYTGTIDTQGFGVTLSGSLTQTSGAFTADASTFAFISASLGQTVNAPDTFGMVVSSNTSAAGLTFANSFTATNFYMNSNGLSSGATVYFASNSSFTIANLSVNGTASKHITLLPTVPTESWYLNNTDVNDLTHIEVAYSNASAGFTILALSSKDLGNNVNWNFGTPVLVTWTGATSTDWGTTTNWDVGFVPRVFDDAVIPATARNPILDKARSVGSLTISDPNAVLSLNNFDFTAFSYISLAGTMTASGNEQIFVGSDWDDSAGAFIAANSTVTFNGGGINADRGWNAAPVNNSQIL